MWLMASEYLRFGSQVKINNFIRMHLLDRFFLQNLPVHSSKRQHQPIYPQPLWIATQFACALYLSLTKEPLCAELSDEFLGSSLLCIQTIHTYIRPSCQTTEHNSLLHKLYINFFGVANSCKSVYVHLITAKTSCILPKCFPQFSTIHCCIV